MKTYLFFDLSFWFLLSFCHIFLDPSLKTLPFSSSSLSSIYYFAHFSLLCLCRWCYRFSSHISVRMLPNLLLKCQRQYIGDQDHLFSGNGDLNGGNRHRLHQNPNKVPQPRALEKKEVLNKVGFQTAHRIIRLNRVTNYQHTLGT